MQEPEAELQATANLSPVSPSPVHSAAPLVVPALQDTVDTIDAMVAAAAAAAAAAPNSGVPEDVALDAVAMASDQVADVDAEADADVVDDDSFNDDYTDDNAVESADKGFATAQQQPADEDEDDDYAKTFDSPIGPEEGEGLEEESQELVSAIPRESNDVTLLPSSDPLNNRPSNASIPLDPSLAHPDAPQPVAEGVPDPGLAPQSTGPDYDGQPQNKSVQPVPAHDTADVTFQTPTVDDIHQLVADLTSQDNDANPSPDPNASSSNNEQSGVPNSTTPIAAALPSPSSLPPRPPQPSSAGSSYAAQHHPAGSKSILAAAIAAPSTPGQPSTYVAAGAPGTSTEAINNLPPPPATGLNVPAAITSLNPPPYPTQVPANSIDRKNSEYQQQWDQFVADERQYMAEAKWDRFPEGSRIFIGNLSSDKVSKRDVFDVFHKFGRLAQISLKSAYGFVQYHGVEEGQRAIDNLQGFEIKGRRIHLEISRVQEKTKRERKASPDKGGRNRDSRDGGRRNDRFNSNNSRDDYRPSRNHSPRRNDYGHESLGRDRGLYDSGRGGRGRSRSPGYGRGDRDSYRHRSPSPYIPPRHEGDLDLPRRYGANVPDVQIILQPEINRDFVSWVEGILKSKGLKTEVMYLHPRMPKEMVIQRQAVEGVHAVVDLDMRAQNTGRIPVQAFDRAAGLNNVRFEQYVDLEPGTAAQVILRAKASGASSYPQPYNGAPAAPPYSGYGIQPQPQPQPPANAYQGAQQAPTNGMDIAGLLGKVDPATLQGLLATFQAQQPPVGGIPGGHAPPSQVDLQAILGTLGRGQPAMVQHQQQQPPQAAYGMPYGAQAPAAPGAASSNPDSAAQVQNIMAQLARYRQ